MCVCVCVCVCVSICLYKCVVVDPLTGGPEVGLAGAGRVWPGGRM